MKSTQTKIIYGFTGFSIFQLIGYLGTAYAWLAQPMFILFLMIVIYCLILGLGKWSTEQKQRNARLPIEIILSNISEPIALLIALIFCIFVGVWIAL